MTNGTDQFKAKMQSFLEKDDKNIMIFTEDLKNMIHIAENANDIELVEKMIMKFTSQNQEIRFGE